MKRQLFNAVLDGAGITSYRWAHLKPGLYCFNFHRVGNDDGSAFHPNLYSCTGEEFSKIIDLLQSRFDMVGLDQVLSWVDTNTAPDRPCGLITFDDGYLDNFQIAFDVLKKARCPGLFFLPTDFIGSGRIPWWDQIAWCIYKMGRGSLEVPGGDRPVEIDPIDLEGSIRRVLRVVKDTPAIPVEEKADEILRQAGCRPFGEDGDQLFLGWEQAREMRRAGMWIGSHTASHQVLSHLSPGDQYRELAESKAVLERELGEPVDSIAYPVGGYAAYTAETKSIAQQCGYRVAFNFVSGANRAPAQRRYELLRMPIERDMTLQDIRRMAAFSKVE